MAEASFSRNSTAYNLDGEQVQVNQPRFYEGKFGQGILLEEGTTNLVTNQNLTTYAGSNYTVADYPALGPDWKKVNFTLSGSNANGYVCYLQTPIVLNGSSYAYSIEFISESGKIIPYVDGSVYVGMMTNVSGNRWYLQYNNTSGAVKSIGIYLKYIPATISALINENVYYRYYQIEQKPYLTSFINGTRLPETLTIPTNSVLSIQEGTVECYLKMNIPSSISPSGVHRNVFSLGGAVFGVFVPNSQPNALAFVFGSWGQSISASISWNVNDILYITATWKAPNYALYIYNITQGTKNIVKRTNGVILPSLTSLLYLGSADGAQFNLAFNGVIDDFRVSNIARSDAEIVNASNSNQPLPIDIYTIAKLNFDGILAYNAYLKDAPITYNKKYLRIYDKNHNVLDEIDSYNDDLQYGWTLNDIDTASFSIGLENYKCTSSNMQHRNHVEIWDGSSNKCIWGGQIAGLSFDNPTLKVNCIDYLSLLKWRRLRAKTYSTTDYGTLMTQLLADINAINPTGVTIGSIATGALQTTRIVQNTDFLLDKIKNFNADVNYDFDVDINRSFNFYLRKGSDKPYYLLEYGGEADNILEAPTLSQDILNMANGVYSEIKENEVVSLSSLAQDSYSQSLYGLVEGIYSANSGVTEQSTLDNQCNGALQRSAYPTSNFTIKAKDSTLCPFEDIQVGDSVTVSLIPYFKFKALMRIIRMVHNESTGVRDITFGEIIYKPQPPVKRFYKKG